MHNRVIFIDTTATVGGAEINLLMQARELAIRGWRVKVILPGQGPLSEKLAVSDIPVDYIPGVPDQSLSFHLGHLKLPNPFAWFINTWKSLIWILRLHRYLVRKDVTLVHTVSFWAHVCGGAAARLAGLPIVAHFQSLVGRSGLGFYRTLIREWARWIPNHIVCISPRVAEQFNEVLGISSKTTVILNTIDVEKFTPAFDTNKEMSIQHTLRIGTVSRFMPWKGQHVAVEAAGILKSEIAFKWVFVGQDALGSSSYAQRVKDRALDLELEEYVEFVDWIDGMPEFYRSLDVLVHVPVKPEPFGLVLGEAMACGVPVITTAGGAEALVRAGAGLIVPFDDAEAVVSALLRLNEKPGERQTRGKKARQTATDVFSVPRYIEQWIHVYRSVEEQACS